MTMRKVSISLHLIFITEFDNNLMNMEELDDEQLFER